MDSAPMPMAQPPECRSARGLNSSFSGKSRPGKQESPPENQQDGLKVQERGQTLYPLGETDRAQDQQQNKTLLKKSAAWLHDIIFHIPSWIIVAYPLSLMLCQTEQIVRWCCPKLIKEILLPGIIRKRVVAYVLVEILDFSGVESHGVVSGIL